MHAHVCVHVCVWTCLQDVLPSMGLWGFGDGRNVQTGKVSSATFLVRKEIKPVPLISRCSYRLVDRTQVKYP